MSDVCGEIDNDERHENQCGLLESAIAFRLSTLNRTHSMISICAKSSSLSLKELERFRTHRRRSRGKGEDRSRDRGFEENYVRVRDKENEWFRRYQ